MKNKLQEVLNKISGNSSEEENLIRNMIRIMTEFGYTLEELKSMPIPTFKTIIDLFIEEDKKVKNYQDKIKWQHKK